MESFKTIKTSKLTGPALDWAVEFVKGGCKAEPHANYWLEKWIDQERRYLCEAASTCWAQGGPIIEREKIGILSWGKGCEGYICREEDHDYYLEDSLHNREVGPTPLIAAMRCYVASKLGDTVEIPTELL